MDREEVIDFLLTHRYKRAAKYVNRSLFVNDNQRQIEETMIILEMIESEEK